MKTEPLSPQDGRDVQMSRVRHDYDSDLSPARVSGAAEEIDSDLSSKWCRTVDGAVTRTHGGSESDLSPPRTGTVMRAHSRHGETYQKHRQWWRRQSKSCVRLFPPLHFVFCLLSSAVLSYVLSCTVVCAVFFLCSRVNFYLSCFGKASVSSDCFLTGHLLLYDYAILSL